MWTSNVSGAGAAPWVAVPATRYLPQPLMVPTPWNCAVEPLMASQSKPVAWKSMGPLVSTVPPWHGVGATGVGATGEGTVGAAGVSVVVGDGRLVVGAGVLAAGAGVLGAGAGGLAAGRPRVT